MRIVCLLIVAVLPLLAHSQQPKDRSITSDDFNKSRPQSKRRTGRIRRYRQDSPPLAKPLDLDSPSTLKAGVTIWKVELIGDGPSRKEIAKRVEADTQFHEGDLLRLSIESPRPGYLYVINRDWFTDGSSGGETNLIFPQRGEDNRLEAGKLIDIPAASDEPFKASPKLNQAGEMLTIIVTSAPLSLSLSTAPLPVSNTQLVAWEKKWGGMNERFEMSDAVGETRTIEEQEAASPTGSRQLTRNDPAPQTIYFLTPRTGDGLLFNLLLSYVR